MQLNDCSNNTGGITRTSSMSKAPPGELSLLPPDQQHKNDDGNDATVRVERLIAKDLYNMSPNERQQVLADIHGVSDHCDDTGSTNKDPTFVRNALDAMDKRLQSNEVKKSYDKALFLSPKYVRDEALRRAFLRAALYDPKKAARRFSLHFHQKLELFGHDLLVKDIGWADLNEADRRAVASFPVVPLACDRSGRRVLLLPSLSKLLNENGGEKEGMSHDEGFIAARTGNPCVLTSNSMGTLVAGKSSGTSAFASKHTASTSNNDDAYGFINIRRAVWFYFMSMAHYDVSIQEKGAVIIGHCFGDASVAPDRSGADSSAPAAQADDNLLAISASFLQATPIRIAAFHLCYDEPNQQVLPAILSRLPKEIRLRARMHCTSTPKESLAMLGSFGIAGDAFPLTGKGRVDDDALAESAGRVSDTIISGAALLAMLPEAQSLQLPPPVSTSTSAWMLYSTTNTAPTHIESSGSGLLVERQQFLDKPCKSLFDNKITDTLSADESWEVHGGKHYDNKRMSETNSGETNETNIRSPSQPRPRSAPTALLVARNPASLLPIIDYPLSKDIVCGRGYPFRTFPGNTKFRELVKSFKTIYDAAGSQSAKTSITCQIIQHLRNDGVRFLKQVGDGWVDVDEEFARTKVAMTFRNLSRER